MWRPIKVKRATKVPDGAGGNTQTYSDLLNTVAEIKDIKTSVQVEGGQYRQVIKTVAIIRKRGGYTPKQTDLIVWNNRDYSIGPMLDINPPQYDKTELTLYAYNG